MGSVECLWRGCLSAIVLSFEGGHLAVGSRRGQVVLFVAQGLECNGKLSLAVGWPLRNGRNLLRVLHILFVKINKQ